MDLRSCLPLSVRLDVRIQIFEPDSRVYFSEDGPAQRSTFNINKIQMARSTHLCARTVVNTPASHDRKAAERGFMNHADFKPAVHLHDKQWKYNRYRTSQAKNK
jgi:hypothetical protein